MKTMCSSIHEFYVYDIQPQMQNYTSMCCSAIV